MNDTIVVSNQVPMPAGGGPHGVLRILATEVAESDDSGLHPILVIEDQRVEWADLSALSSARGNEPPIRPIARLRRVLGQCRVLNRLMRERRSVSIIQFEVPRASLLLKLMHPRRVRLTVSEHSKGGLDAEARAAGASRITVIKVWLSTRLAFASADRIIWPSQGAIEEFHRRHRTRTSETRKYSVVHNGIRLTRGSSTSMAFSAGPPPKHLVLVAADVPDKNVDGVVRVLAEALHTPQTSSYALEWIGGPPDRYLASPTWLPVISRGTVSVDEVRQALDQAFAFVALPHRTIFDLAVLEAMAAGLPVICPPLTGFVEALGDDYPLYATTPAQFRRALLTLEDVSTRSRIGRRLRARVEENFTARTMLAGYFDQTLPRSS